MRKIGIATQPGALRNTGEQMGKYNVMKLIFPLSRYYLFCCTFNMDLYYMPIFRIQMYLRSRTTEIAKKNEPRYKTRSAQLTHVY